MHHERTHHQPHEHRGHPHGGHGRGTREHHPEMGPPLHGRGGHGGGPGGPGGGRGGRVRRGESRWLLLDALTDGPKHGYEIIRSLTERSGGRYVPSPGTVYPVLQFLEEAGYVRAEQGDERRIYSLTESGQAELAAHAEEIRRFWQETDAPILSAGGETEMGFLREEMEFLHRTAMGGLRRLPGGDRPETIRRVRQAVESCRNTIRDILAEQNSDTARAEQDPAQEA